MAHDPKLDPPIRYADKELLRRLMAELNKELGVEPDPDATIEKLRELAKAEGIRPEDNIFSRDIIRARYGDGFRDEE